MRSLRAGGRGNTAVMLLRTIARPLLSAAFIGQGLESLLNPQAAGEAARPALDGARKLPGSVSDSVPTDPAGVERFARAVAVVQIGAGALLASGKLPRVASATLAFTVIPSRVGAHMFWTADDPEVKAQQRRALLADLSLLGGLMIASADTAGRPSLGWRGRRAARKISEAVAGVAPNGDSEVGEKLAHGLHVGAERGREWMETALDKSAPLVEAARDRGGELVDVARERGAELADIARDRGADLADMARERGSELADIARDRGTDLAVSARARGAELADSTRRLARSVT